MKNTILTLALFVTSFATVSAQQALLKLNSGTSQQVYITDVDSLYLTTSKGIYELDDIEEVVFNKKKGRQIDLYYTLEDAGLKIRFDENLQLTNLKPPQLNGYADEQLRNKFKKYKKAHQLGTGLQFAGVLLAVVALLTEDNSFAYAGAATSIAGLAIEIGASGKAEWDD